MAEANEVWSRDDKLDADSVKVSGIEAECCWFLRLESTMLSKTLAVADRLDMRQDQGSFRRQARRPLTLNTRFNALRRSCSCRVQ